MNVAGPRASKDPKIYSDVKFIMSCILLLSANHEIQGAAAQDSNPGHNHQRRLSYPKNLDEASNRVISELPYIDRIIIANMEVEELDPVRFAFDGYIRYHFGLEKGNVELIRSCREAADETDLDQKNSTTVIVYYVWEQLREDDSYRLLR